MHYYTFRKAFSFSSWFIVSEIWKKTLHINFEPTSTNIRNFILNLSGVFGIYSKNYNLTLDGNNRLFTTRFSRGLKKIAHLSINLFQISENIANLSISKRWTVVDFKSNLRFFFIYQNRLRGIVSKKNGEPHVLFHRKS